MIKEGSVSLGVRPIFIEHPHVVNTISYFAEINYKTQIIIIIIMTVMMVMVMMQYVLIGV